jgi:hypothetical protein
MNMSIYDEIPEFEIEHFDSVSTFLFQNRITVSRLVVNAVQRALDEDLLEFPVMKLCVSGLPITLIIAERQRFTESLQKCLEHFKDAEEYEECAKIVKILEDPRII